MSNLDQLAAYICVLSMTALVGVQASGAAQYRGLWRTSCLRAMAVVLIGASVPVYCTAEPIVWLALAFPPGVIIEGPEQGLGYTDQLIGAVLHNLSQYPITTTSVPAVRELQILQKGGSYCTADLLKTTERLEFLRFTSPVGYVLPIALVVRAEDKDHYDRYADANHILSLDLLMRTDPGVLGIAARRTFGKMADKVIAQVLAKHPSQIAQSYQVHPTESLLNLLATHHVDAVLAFPIEQIYWSGHSEHGDNYYVYPIAESQELMPMRFSCTRQAATDDLFTDLDVQAKSADLQHTFQLAYERWLPPYMLPLYRARLNDNAKTPLVSK